MARSGTVNKLTMAQQFELIKFTQEHYASSNMFDPEFAQRAQDALGFPVTSGNIQGVREQFNIESTLAKQRAAAPETIIERIKELEKKMTKVVDVLERLGEKL